MENITNILFLSPHTDDVELGCGGTISRLIREGKNIWVAIFSICDDSLPEGYKPGSLKDECINSLVSLGVPLDNIIFFNYKVRYFNYERQSILENLVNLKRKINPDMVFLPSVDDYHQDHKTIADESIRCFKNNCTLLSYELIWNNTGFKNQIYFVLNETDINNKFLSLKNYKSQSHRNYFSNDFIKSLATVRGIQNGVNYAESFEVIRFKI
jgi:LmbE family N-acetylglucosaminyl deacetylase